MGTSDRLRDGAADLWEECFAHPFVQGIGDGTLPEAAFQRYLLQDYVFLVEYARVLAFASGKAPTLDAQTHFARLLEATLVTEMSLHRDLCAEWGISPDEMEAAEPLPTTSGYASFLVKTAAAGEYGELVASLLPCQWGYGDIGARLSEGGLPDHERYAAWISTYADPEYQELVSWLREHTDELGERIDENTYRRWETCFRTSLRWEQAFWEMAWGGERWPP